MREVIRFWMPEIRANTFGLDHSASTSSLEAGIISGKIREIFFKILSNFLPSKDESHNKNDELFGPRELFASSEEGSSEQPVL